MRFKLESAIVWLCLFLHSKNNFLNYIFGAIMFAKSNRLYLISIATFFLVFGIYTLSPPKFAIAQSNTTNGVCVGALNFARKGQLPQDGTTTSISYRLDYNFSSSTASLEALSTNSDSMAAESLLPIHLLAPPILPSPTD